MKTLITGAAGNMGREISRALAGQDLVFVNRRNVDFLPEGTQYTADMLQPEALQDIMAREKPDTIIHLAAMIGGACEQDPAAAEAVNVEATRILGQLAVDYGVKQFLFASTAAVYKQTQLSPTDENSNIEPGSVYGRTKLEAENALRDLAEGSSTAFTAFRIFNVYGPMFGGSLVHRLINSSAENPVQVSNPNTFYRDYIHVSDVVEVFTAPELQRLIGFNALNIASGKTTNTSDLISELQAKGVQPHYEVTDGTPTYSWADISKAKEAFGFSPSQQIIVD